MTASDQLRHGRDAFVRRRWREAYEMLAAADRRAPLHLPDLERLGMAAYLSGRDAESTDLLVRAHQGCIAQGDRPRAVRCGFWLAMGLLTKGEVVQAGGWIERARRLLDEEPRECVERGYLLVPEALRRLNGGDVAGAEKTFADAAAIGERFAEADLVNLARHGQGRALIRLGNASRGLALLDEVMVAVTADELSPIVAGVVYCSAISACLDLLDLNRAHAWTEALNSWCAAQPDLVPYRGYCLIHRAEIMQMHGVWADAMQQAQQAFERLSEAANKPGTGAALYQLAELHRLRGELDEAERAYRLASESGRTPQPGLALLRLAQGRVDAARAAISRILEEVQVPKLRASILAAAAEIMLACGDVSAARRSADELVSIAAALEMPFLRAMSAQVMGAVSLASGDPKGALAELRAGCVLWNELDVPYEAARTRVLVGLACHALGDVDTGELELHAARRAFTQLGAARDLARLENPPERSLASPASATGLTSRELQVLQLVASGKTNRGIAGELGISEKTVARHIANIFTKLDLTSRAAATAYAFQHRLV